MGKKHLASALIMSCCCWEAQHVVSMMRATPLVTHPEDGTGNMEVQTMSLGCSKPHAQNPKCKSYGRMRILPCLSTPSLIIHLYLLSYLCWIASISPHRPFLHSFLSCSIPRSVMFMAVSLAFWLLVGLSQWEAPA